MYAIKYIRGIAIANDLKTIVEGDTIALVGNDLAKTVFLEEGYFTNTFINDAKALEWDILPVKGGYLVEYPIGHQKLIDEIQKKSHLVYEYQMNIASFSKTQAKQRGVSFDQFLEVQLDLFDWIHKGFSVEDIAKGALSLRYQLSPRQIENILDGTVTCKASGMAGRPVTNQIIQQMPYEVFSRNREGELVSQRLEFIESGITIKSDAYRTQDGISVQFDIEVSNALPGTKQFPTITRRKTTTDIYLKINQVEEIARINIGYQQTQTRKRWFFGTHTANDDTEETLVVLVKRIR